MTTTDAVNWLNAQVGQYKDFDGQYGAQCVDLFNFYYQYITGRNPYGDGYGVPGAKDLWNVATSRFTKIGDSPSLVPQPGDILIYGASWGGGYGHVEMVVGTDSKGCTIVGNNLVGNPRLPVARTYRTWAQMRGLIGVMRFNGFNQGDEIMNTDEDVILAYNNFRIDGNPLGTPNAGEIAFWRGKSFRDILRAARAGEVVARNAQFKALQNFHAVWSPKLDELNSRTPKAEYEKVVTEYKTELKALQDKLAEELAKPPEIQTVTETVVEKVNVPLSWKTVLPWVVEEIKRRTRRKP